MSSIPGMRDRGDRVESAADTTTRKVYISGPMSGLPEFNYPAFFRAAEIVRSHGHEPINPAEGVTEFDRPWEWYMKRDLRLLLDADEVWMLPGWHSSKGARLEHTIADILGMPVRDAGEGWWKG